MSWRRTPPSSSGHPTLTSKFLTQPAPEGADHHGAHDGFPAYEVYVSIEGMGRSASILPPPRQYDLHHKKLFPPTDVTVAKFAL